VNCGNCSVNIFAYIFHDSFEVTKKVTKN